MAQKWLILVIKFSVTVESGQTVATYFTNLQFPTAKKKGVMAADPKVVEISGRSRDDLGRS